MTDHDEPTTIDKGYIDKTNDRWIPTGRRARRHRAYGYGTRNEHRSRCQRITNEQRRTNRKLHAHEARKAKRREQRRAAEVAA